MLSSTLFSDAMALTTVSSAGDVHVYRRRAERALDHRREGARRGDAGVVREGRQVGAHGRRGLVGAADRGVRQLPVGAGPLGASRWCATVRKRGRRVNLVDAELKQGPRTGDERSRDEPRTAVRAAVTLGEPEHHVAPLLSVNPVIPLMQPEPPPGLEPIGSGHPMADIVHLAHGCDIRPSLTTMEPRSDGGPPVIEYWVRPRDEAPDVLFALLCGDVSAPVTFGVNRFGWAPTVQLTAYLRALPADGWLRVLCTTVQIGQDWFDEDHIVVDSEGHIVVQSRQLAMVPAAQ